MMFKLYVMQLLQSEELLFEKPLSATPQASVKRNRRLTERFAVDHKHLAMMHEQDILSIQDVSEGGLRCITSPRAFELFHVGQRYLAKMRYVGEVYSITCQVAWKQHSLVGFQWSALPKDLKAFVQRLLLPMETGRSLLALDPKLVAQKDNRGLEWYQGLYETNLYVWKDEGDEIVKWRLDNPKAFVLWHHEKGLNTSETARPLMRSLGKLGFGADVAIFQDASQQKASQQKASIPDPGLVQWAIDVLMAASEVGGKEALIGTILDWHTSRVPTRMPDTMHKI